MSYRFRVVPSGSGNRGVVWWCPGGSGGSPPFRGEPDPGNHYTCHQEREK